MKIITEPCVVQTHNNQTGQPIEVKGVKKAIAITKSGLQVFAPLDALKQGANTVTYKKHEKGDTFVANRDSSRVWAEGMPDYKAENKGNPLYLKGETVTRTSESLEFVAFSTEEQFTGAQKEKMEFAKSLGLTVTI